MRLIDADALEKRLDNEKWMDNYDRDFIVDVALYEAPTVDAVPVVHGKWLRVVDERAVDAIGNYVAYRKCSECGQIWTDKYAVDTYFHYCFNCGAKMDGKDDDNENR